MNNIDENENQQVVPEPASALLGEKTPKILSMQQSSITTKNGNNPSKLQHLSCKLKLLDRLDS